MFAATPVEVGWKDEGPPLPLVGLQHLRTCYRVIIVIVILVLILISNVIVIRVVIGKRSSANQPTRKMSRR